MQQLQLLNTRPVYQRCSFDVYFSEAVSWARLYRAISHFPRTDWKQSKNCLIKKSHSCTEWKPGGVSQVQYPVSSHRTSRPPRPRGVLFTVAIKLFSVFVSKDPVPYLLSANGCLHSLFHLLHKELSIYLWDSGKEANHCVFWLLCIFLGSDTSLRYFIFRLQRQNMVSSVCWHGYHFALLKYLIGET